MHSMIRNLLVFLAILTPVVSAAVKTPNVLVILADDLGYADVGFNGCKDIRTPNIDRLAGRSIICTDGHVAASVCAPSRAGLLTGRYQNRFGFEFNGGRMEPDVVTSADQFRAAGFATLGVGKWHLGPKPSEVGFDHFTGLMGGSRSYKPSAKTNREQRMTRDGKDVEMEGWSYLTDFMTEEGMRMVRERDATKPFFLYMSYTTPHTPLDTRPDLEKEYASIEHKGRRKYAAMVASLDEEVGEWLDFLDKEDLTNNTLVFFLSDNGGATINWSDNGFLRGMKGSYWEGGQRVPFLVSWPGKLKPGWYNNPVISLDITPTTLALAGAEAKDSDGVNLVPFLDGSRTGRPHERLFWRMDPTRAVREGDTILIKVLEDDGGTHKVLMFDLKNDPGQQMNLADRLPEERDRLLDILAEWEQTLAEPNSKMAKVYRDNHRKKHSMDVIGRDAERKLP